MFSLIFMLQLFILQNFLTWLYMFWITHELWAVLPLSIAYVHFPIHELYTDHELLWHMHFDTYHNATWHSLAAAFYMMHALCRQVLMAKFLLSHELYLNCIHHDACTSINFTILPEAAFLLYPIWYMHFPGVFCWPFKYYSMSSFSNVK